MESAANGGARVKRSSKTTGKPKQEGTQQSTDSVNQELLLCGSSYYVPGFVKEVDKTEQSCSLILLSGKGLWSASKPVKFGFDSRSNLKSSRAFELASDIV